MENKDQGAAAPQMQRDPVPVCLWSKDHWSTFAYIGTRVVGADGQPDKNKMRTDTDRHPAMCGPAMAPLRLVDPKKYPTRIHKDRLLADHDDWDCAEDAEAAGLLVWGGTGLHPIFSLTDLGWAVLRELTEHKNRGGSFTDFVPSAAVVLEATRSGTAEGPLKAVDSKALEARAAAQGEEK